MPRRSTKKGVRDRMYRRQGRGWYVDLRDLGGGREALIDRERGETGACEDFDRAYELAKARIKLAGGDPPLEDYARYHLDRKRQRRRLSTCERDEIGLRHVTDFLRRSLGREPRLSDATEERLSAYMHRRGSKVADQTLAHELHALSNLFKRAIGERRALYNPVPLAKSADGFTVRRDKPEWLEIGEAGKLLRVTAEMDAERRKGQRCPYLHAVVATGLLTGARPGEILGMETTDVDLDAGRVHIRHNTWRRLKRPWHERSVPLWPQLRETLEAYLEKHSPDGLLFPSHLTGRPYTNLNDALRAAFERAEIDKEARFYILRHTYCATRIQTLDRGAPVSPYTVAEEMGHRNLDLIMRTYGHLQRDRRRLARVQYTETPVIDIRQAKGA